MENDEDIDEIEEMILEEGKRNHSKISLLYPVCNSSNVTYHLGGQISYMYQGKDCGYIGTLIIDS